MWSKGGQAAFIAMLRMLSEKVKIWFGNLDFGQPTMNK